MIVVTGGAGFIGSVLVWRLNQLGYNEILIVDHLGKNDKWKNLVSLSFIDYIDKDEFILRLEKGEFDNKIEVLFHLGACSSTTEKDARYLIENNYKYSVRIATWWQSNKKTRFIYASSAATYGNGEKGYSDDERMLPVLRPLNIYGYSKHLFDLYAYKKGWLKEIVGLKYFNVFGPNENHKGEMRSLINKSYPHLIEKGEILLFESYNEKYLHGEQKRDFIYVKDAVEITLFFMEHNNIGGIFNVGTGVARSWNDLAKAMFEAIGRKPNIKYIPMPEDIRDKYQYFTQADVKKLKSVGCNYSCSSLEVTVKEYITEYLSKDGFLY